MELYFQTHFTHFAITCTYEISPQNPIDDKSTMVQVMAWCRQATRHYLNQSWPIFMSLYGVTMPQNVDSTVTSSSPKSGFKQFRHPGPRCNNKIPSYQYRKCHCGDKTVLSPQWDSLYWQEDIFILNQGPGPYISTITRITSCSLRFRGFLY